MGSKSKTLGDLFLHTLKDVYYAEKHIGKLLSKLRKAAVAEELKQAFDEHREQTVTHVERLERVFELLGKKVHAVPCEAILGLIEESKEVIDEFEDSPALDAGLIAAAQAVEHYEIARYGALAAWASLLALTDVAALLQETLGEEKAADARLGDLAESLNRPAVETAGAENHPAGGQNPSS